MMIRGALTFFVWLFFLDGVMSVIRESLDLYGEGAGWFSGVSQMMAVMTLAMGFMLYVLCTLTPRLPKRVLVPAGLFLLWASLSGGFPMTLWTGVETGLVLSVIQCALGILFFLTLRGREQFFPLRNPCAGKPEFTAKNLLVFTGVNVVLIPVLLTVFAVGQSITGLERSTAGFIQFRPEGIYLQERQFEKGDRRVHLVGMMHVANKNFYNEVLGDIPQKGKSIVLLEGVTDDKKVLKGDLGMARIGRALGIDSQSDSPFADKTAEAVDAEKHDKPQDENDPVHYQRSDGDISDFRDETIACLKEISQLAAAKSWVELLRILSSPTSAFHDEKNAQIMMEDILHGRNNIVLSNIDTSMAKYSDIFVPWGALHMPYLEQKLKEKGFREVSRKDRKAVSFY